MNIKEAQFVLGLTAPFTAEEAKISYRRLALTYHPDKGGDTNLMKKLNAAYKLCSKGISISFGSAAPNIGINGVEFKFKTKKKRTIRHRITLVVGWFSGRMLKKLVANVEDKGFSWRDERTNLLYSKLVGECVELRTAMGKLDKQGIINECADVANFAMMIADNANRKL